MSKISDKLQRLHQSRIHAIDRKQTHEGIFFADQSEVAINISPLNPTSVRKEKAKNRTFTTLSRQSALKEKSGKNQRAREIKALGSYQLKAPTTYNSPKPILGERLKDLRIQAQALIDAGRRESALPLLFEMVAYSPEHVFALSKLVEHFKHEEHLHDLFSTRLKKVAHY